MVLYDLGVDVSESELRIRCDCTILGTDALKAVDAARQLGFTRSRKYTLGLHELREVSALGRHPIAFVSLLPIDAREDTHAVVVLRIDQRDTIVLDPLAGERAIPLDSFRAAWAMRHNLALIIER
jgi:ABC-type bacteriocin/lantibiotic exporter with double-glycine peptidase domain